MSSPNYQYRPWSAERRSAASARQRTAAAERKYRAVCASIAVRERALSLLSSFYDSDGDGPSRDAAIFIMAAGVVGTDPKQIAKFTGINPARCHCYARRAREIGIFVGDRVDFSRYGSEKWFGLSWLGDPTCRWWRDVDLGIARCINEDDDKAELAAMLAEAAGDVGAWERHFRL